MTTTDEALRVLREQIAIVQERLNASTPTAGAKKARYDHGGGRMLIDGETRNLLLDAYGDAEGGSGDREFYFNVREDVEALLAALASVLPVLQTASDEEVTPHAFNSRTRYEPGDDRDIWCKDCEYHRDHAIHTPAVLEAPEPQMLVVTSLDDSSVPRSLVPIPAVLEAPTPGKPERPERDLKLLGRK